MKRCHGCGIEKDESEFHKQKRSPDGLRSRCNPCRAAEARDYHSRNREKTRATYRAWAEKNAEGLKAYGAEWHAKNRDRRIVQARAHYYRRQKEHPTARLYASAKGRAKRLGLPFDLHPDDILIPETCPVLGIPLYWRVGRNGPSMNSPSLDRFDPKGGYTKANIVVISHRANTLKNNASVEEIARVLAYMQSKPMTVQRQLDACAAGEPTTPWVPEPAPLEPPKSTKRKRTPKAGSATTPAAPNGQLALAL